ncbi:hypothetical protein HD554DRAFT_2300903 [Boletus coccyginus]|nr:hypothetical protein HD554DRAFT_2300903 [Boletus coccyginus]
MSSSTHHTAARNRKSEPCRLYSQGRCRFGGKCKFSHEADVEFYPTRSMYYPSSSLSHNTSDTRPRPKRGEVPCRAWKAGTCAKGSKCWSCHDIDVKKSGLESSKQHKRDRPTSRPESLSVEEEHNLLETMRVRVQVAEATAARERANAIAREEASKTINQVVFGSIVTYSAGLDVPNLITGFETCTLRIGNLPLDVKEDDIHALLRGQGVDVNYFHFVIKMRPDRRLEAHIVTDIAAGRAIALGLDGAEYQEETLVVEMSGTNSLEGMSAATGQSSEVLTISWHAPSARYIAEYVDVATANAKVKELNRSIYGGRRIKVEMNAQPPGRFDVVGLTRSISVKRLAVGGAFGHMYTTEQIARLVQDDIERAVPGGLEKFDDPPRTCAVDGVVSARAHFSSWDEAHAAYTHLSDRRYGNQTVWLRLPDPMHFTLVIPTEQYKAQKAQWDSLLNSIKDRRACTLNVRDTGNVVHIRLSGSVKEATGALKVRVENLARGDKVDGWHRSLGFPGNSFVTRVRSETGAYLRADWKQQSLKVYGAPRAVDQAREMIKGELDRLASLDYTVTVARHSVGFFVREGIQELKETLGENNVRFAMSSRKITVSGGEEARHALDRLIMLSQKGNCGLPSASQGSQTCPICYDNVSSPHQLGCGHTYCVACLRHFISSALESDQLPLTCLGDEAQCRVPITIPTIQQFLPPASFNRLLEAAFDAYIAKHPEEFKHCKTPDCTQIYRAVQAGASPQTLHCPSCFSAVCNGCHEDVHDGLSCAESKARRDPAEQERLNDAWIASQGGRVKKCPQCSVLIEKIEGCNHMTCRCGAHICWRCTGIFTQDTIYTHMQSAHGTIHDDVPVFPEPPPFIGIEVDIEEQQELFRQVEAHRAAALRNARPAWQQDIGRAGIWDLDYLNLGHQVREHVREEQERMERLRLQQQREAEERQRVERLRLQQQREVEERQRMERLRLQRQQEAEERERVERLRLQRQREAEEWNRRVREEHGRQEHRRREQEEPQSERGGWSLVLIIACSLVLYYYCS